VLSRNSFEALVVLSRRSNPECSKEIGSRSSHMKMSANRLIRNDRLSWHVQILSIDSQEGANSVNDHPRA
jgi:hypothetical protein